MKIIATALLCLMAFLVRSQEAVTPAGHVELFNGKDFSGLTFYMRSNAAPENTWSISNGLIHCTGKPTGYLRTEKSYRDFVATAEWRFLKAGNTGVCVFMQDRAADASPRSVWPHCVECQGMHDHMGDFWLQGGTTCTEPVNMGKNGIKMLQPSAESPVGEWTTFQAVCRGNTVEIIVNGKSMNKITGVDVSAGYIGLQSEGADMEVRKFFLEPLPKP
ncbi:MAG TPA: DUF1080 domain-containing protein [Candidatus Acidoferrales bacterium]|jgi:hypothetical protein|nr:DUF1080 domain-containing protein [Candidatus Acidoferrales bacterium]